MSTTQLYTYTDVVTYLLDTYGLTSTDAQTERKCKRAVETAYRYLAYLRPWTYYHKDGRMQVNAAYNTGTVAYTHTGGSYERVVTLTSGTWPSWAKYGFIRISSVDYDIEDRKSDTEITLSVNSNPGADIASGTSYYLLRDAYPWPVDCYAIGMIRDPVNWWYPQYLSPNEFFSLRRTGESVNNPRNFTIIQDKNYVGSLAIRFYPPPSDNFNYEYLYRRTPRDFGVRKYNTGTVSTSGTTLTGSGTAFTSQMVDCVITFSSSTTAPTDVVGSNPYLARRIILGYTTATGLVLDQALDSDVSGVAYEISDPIDVEAGAMYTAFLKRCELEFAQLMLRDDVQRFAQQYRDAEVLAMEADSRNFSRPGQGSWRRVPLRWRVTNA